MSKKAYKKLLILKQNSFEAFLNNKGFALAQLSFPSTQQNIAEYRRITGLLFFQCEE